MQSKSAPRETAPGRLSAAALLALLVIVPAAIVVLAGAIRHPESLAAGDRIAPLMANDLAGKPLRLDTSSAGGGPRVWLIVSASCAICRSELAEMQKARVPYSGVTIISLSSLKETRDLMRPFPALQRQTAIDSQGVLQRTYGRFRTPTGLLIGNGGVLVQKWRGIRLALMRKA